MSDIIVDTDLREKAPPKTVTLEMLDGAINCPLAIFYNMDTKQRGIVVNTQNIPELWDIYHELEDVIKSIKIQLIRRSQMTAVQAAPASVLDTLRGTNAK